MSGFTLLLVVMLMVLYLYLLLVRRDIVFISKRRSTFVTAVPFLAVGALLLSLSDAKTLEDQVRGVVAAFFILSFLFDSRGLAKDRIVSNAMDLRGIPYEEVGRVVLLFSGGKTKMNFFRLGMRGPLLIFEAPVEEVVLFLTEHLPKGTPIDVLLEQHPDDH